MSDDGQTLRTEALSEQPTLAAPATGKAGSIELPPAGYEYGELIGRGGMGEVIAAHDLRIGRDVAIKRMRDGRADQGSIARFLREARIQARLDHPAIVPVHELGTDPEGRPYFTMKRLAGETLADRLQAGGKMQPLLRAFIDVCLAIELAHARGVVHRDLKPANIILGDYGETYVLDWGVARVIDEHDERMSVDALDTLEDQTQTGAIMGTPGYMAPEQIRGEMVTGATDVYALGAMLFEILAAEALHPRGTAGLAMALAQPQDSPAKRRPELDIAPELDAACWDALSGDPAARPRARALAKRVEDYLDGDRDKERRRTMAEARLVEARAATEHAQAIHLAGQAVALAPDYADATQYLLELVVTPPRVDPPELVESLAEERRQLSRARNQRGAVAYASFFLLWAFIPFMKVISWPWLIAFFAIVAAAAVGALVARHRGSTNIWMAMLATLAMAVAASRVAGPLMLVPVLLCGAIFVYTAHPWFSGHPLRVAGFGTVATMLPIVLEWVGVLPRTYSVEALGIETHSTVFAMTGWTEVGALIATNVAFVLATILYAHSVNHAASVAQTRVQRQTWALRQLLPKSRR